MHGAHQQRHGVPRKGADATAEVKVTLEDVYHGGSRDISLQVDGQVDGMIIGSAGRRNKVVRV